MRGQGRYSCSHVVDDGLISLLLRLFPCSYKPSGADSSLLLSIRASVDAKKYANVARWLKQITSFTPEQRATWAGAVVAPAAASASASSSSAAAAAPAAAAAKPAAAAKKADSDDDFAMSSEDDEETLAIIAKKNAEKAEKAKGKPALIAKSSVILFVKPLEAETDMNEVAKKIKTEIVMDSLQSVTTTQQRARTHTCTCTSTHAADSAFLVVRFSPASLRRSRRRICIILPFALCQNGNKGSNEARIYSIV